MTALKDETQGPSDRLRLRSLFVIAQVAVSILLVIAAGLLGRALGRVSFADQGFDSGGVSIASADLSMAGYTEAEGRRFVRDLRDAVRRVPGVHSVTIADRLPGGPVLMESNVRERGAVPPAPATALTSWTRVEPGYFATLKIPMVAGREFSESDTFSSQPVVIVDESTARRLWPGQGAVGQYLPASVRSMSAPNAAPSLVVGVARDVRPAGRRWNVSVLFLYAPLQQLYSPRVTLLARSDGGAHTVAALRSAVTALDPDIAVLEAHALSEAQSGPVVVQLRIATLVAGSVGLIGLLLAAVGIYGVTAYAASQRTREIGIRLTLGATHTDVIWMILRQGLALVAIGAVLGLTAAAAGARLLRHLLFGLPTLDPLAFGGAALLFAAVGLAACYLPARRATRITAMEALRYE